MRKHGIEKFDFCVVAELPTADEAKIAERILIALEKPDYNLTAGGDGTHGLKHSEQQREKNAAAKRGKPLTDAHKEAIRASVVGVPKSLEMRTKLSATRRRMKHSPETKAKMSASQKKRAAELRAQRVTAGGEGAPGLQHTPEARANMSKARIGNKNSLGCRPSAETRAKLSAAKKGVPKSPEHRAAIGAAHVGMKRSPEACARMSAAQKASFARRKQG